MQSIFIQKSALEYRKYISDIGKTVRHVIYKKCLICQMTIKITKIIILFCVWYNKLIIVINYLNWREVEKTFALFLLLNYINQLITLSLTNVSHVKKMIRLSCIITFYIVHYNIIIINVGVFRFRWYYYDYYPAAIIKILIISIIAIIGYTSNKKKNAALSS